MTIDGEDLSMIVSWDEDTDHDVLVSCLVALNTGRLADMIENAIKAYGKFSEDPDFAALLAEGFKEKMAPHLAKKSKLVVPPRACIPTLMRGRGE